jgi:nucleoside-diphosphate-sugar epimerase
MRILLAGASGVLGRATLPHLVAHDVVGLTRSRDKVELVRDLGAEAIVCDVYDSGALVQLARRVRPQTVVNFVTALAEPSSAANDRVRREGGANLRRAAEAANASRLVVESVAFPLEGDAGRAVEALEETTRAFHGDGVTLRFGRLWGPGTAYAVQPEPPAISINQAGAEAARLLMHAAPGTYVIAS